MEATLPEVNARICQISDELMKRGAEMNEVTDKFLMAKAKYEQEYSRFFLETKLKSPDMTGPELTATAKNLARDFHYDAVRCDSSYRKIRWELKSLTEQLDALKQVSFNLRREALI